MSFARVLRMPTVCTACLLCAQRLWAEYRAASRWVLHCSFWSSRWDSQGRAPHLDSCSVCRLRAGLKQAYQHCGRAPRGLNHHDAARDICVGSARDEGGWRGGEAVCAGRKCHLLFEEEGIVGREASLGSVRVETGGGIWGTVWPLQPQKLP